jgi:glycyl-tRNA synthetase beta chain
MPELLLELFSEEIPARMQARAAADLKRLVCEKLKEQGLTFDRADAYATPRRLALVVDGLPEKQPDRTIEKKGPRVGAPDKAIEGFLRSAGLTSLDQCEKRDDGKGEVWFAVGREQGKSTCDALGSVLNSAILRLPWPKTMRFADQQFRFVRPLRNVLAVFGTEKVKVNLLPATIDEVQDFDAIQSVDGVQQSEVAIGNMVATWGHRFLAPDSFEVSSFADYKQKLFDRKVILDPAERRAVILKQAQALAAKEGLTLVEDAGLLDEVTGLVEWPVVLSGSIDTRFMALPPEVLTTTMRTNQKYFALNDKGGKLAPKFLVVSNMETKDEGAAIVAGNERVLRARLSDAEFFWNQDRKTPLEHRIGALEQIVFHAKLGTVAERVNRIETLAGEIAKYVPGADVDKVRRAARLAKADLTTGMVGEFPELQGTMGRYYALDSGEDAAVADAIAEHYAPLGPTDRCPTESVSVAVALADKIDTLAGFFGIGEPPTGSKDPFALRRAALGTIRLIVENGLRVRLAEVLRKSNFLYAEMEAGTDWTLDAQNLMAFFADRLKVMLRDRGARHDLVAAVFALGGEDDLVRLLARVDALQKFLESDDGANLLVAYRRAANIVRIEEKKDKATYEGPVDPDLLTEAPEKTLHAALATCEAAVERTVGAEDFADAMAAMAALRGAVDDFFDKVTVNCDDAGIRANRLRLLAQIRRTLDRVADFSAVEG